MRLENSTAKALRYDVLCVASLLLLNALAFSHLMTLPVFEDEGSQLGLIFRLLEAGEWRQALVDGKPLEIWLMAPLARLGLEPLAAIRSTHVFAGMCAAVLTYTVARQLGDRASALASGALFVVCPFVVYLERLALADILMCAAGTWVILAVLEFTRSPSVGRAGALAAALVAAALTKMPVGFVFLSSLPLALVLMPADARRFHLAKSRLVRLLASQAPAALLALAVLLVAWVRWRRGQVPGFGLQDLIGIGSGRTGDIAAAIGVARPTLVQELGAQLTAPVVLIGGIGITASALLNDWRHRWLIAVGILPMLAIGLLAHFWYSRYLLFTLPPLMVAAVAGWRSLWLRTGPVRHVGAITTLGVCIALMGHQSARLLLDPASARWSPIDRFQYLEGWSSGYGYPQAADFIRNAAAPPMIYALDAHSAYQLRTYLPPEWAARVQPVAYGTDNQALRSQEARLEGLLSHTPAWVIIPEPLVRVYLDLQFGSSAAEHFRLRKIIAFDKPGARTQLSIYEVTRR